MITEHTCETLRAFEQTIAEDFNSGKIRAPVHLDGGCEEQLIDIFQNVDPDDWIFSTWRSHFHCLLKGVPPDQLREDIIAGRSITLCYPEYRIVSSAIVAGVIPIAVGVAMAIKRRYDSNKVWVFIGDMAWHSGMFAECARYASGHDLPIEFVVEDNGKSVCTDTQETWGIPSQTASVTRFRYDLPWPHAGAGKRVQF